MIKTYQDVLETIAIVSATLYDREPYVRPRAFLEEESPTIRCTWQDRPLRAYPIAGGMRIEEIEGDTMSTVPHVHNEILEAISVITVALYDKDTRTRPTDFIHEEGQRIRCTWAGHRLRIHWNATLPRVEEIVDVALSVTPMAREAGVRLREWLHFEKVRQG